MQTFLQKAASHILAAHPEGPQHLSIVVPTRRAAFFMMQELAQATTKPVISPSVTAIDDFIENTCSLKIQDSVHLLLELYDTFKTVDPEVGFDRFMGWAAVLLADIDKIDQYLVDSDKLFEFLSEEQALSRWQAQLPNGKTLQTSGGATQYFRLFDHISQVYQLFRQNLMAKGLAYRGMAYRQVAEQAETISAKLHDVEKIYFAGFNAFTAAEEKIIAALVKTGKAETLWDSDSYYMQHNTGVEAGKNLRSYAQSGLFGSWQWTEDHLTTSAKNITIYGVPNAVLQTKVAGSLYSDMLAGDDPENPVMTAIVLADENLLQPMLYSLDDDVRDFNITMGLSLKNSLLYTLIDSLFELQQNTVEFRGRAGRMIRVPKFSHKTVAKVLNHPFIRHYEHIALERQDDGQTIIQRTLSAINKDNIVFLSSEELLQLGDDHALFQILFVHWPKNKPWQVITTFYLLIDLLRGVYKDYKNALETEYLYLFYTLLKQFEQTVAEQMEAISLKTLRSFMFELIRQTRIPFSGEPVSMLQILGMLETRALDFQRLIILSVNEGIIPQGKRQNSLIPHDALVSFGMPTYQQQEAVMSYHFYRLLQRASEVHLLYASTNDAPGGGERSRFVQQVEYELTQYNPNIQINRKTVVLGTEAEEPRNEDIPKDDGMIAAIRSYLAGKGIYPTHLNEYIRCSMQFYLKHIVGVQEKEEVEEELGMDKIGTWLHASLERLDIVYFLEDKDPSEEEIKAVLRSEFDRLFRGYVTDLGLNRIYYQVGEQQILTFLTHHMAQTPRREILAAEQALRTSLTLVLQGNYTQVNMGGKIDRIELADDGTLYVMDYKTGSVDVAGKQKLADAMLREEMLKTDGDIKMGYVRQLWLYEFLMYRKMFESNGLMLKNKNFAYGEHRVRSGFYSFRDPKNQVSNPLELTDELDVPSFLAKSLEILTDILNDMLDPDVPFTKTNNLKTCTFCDFKGICGR